MTVLLLAGAAPVYARAKAGEEPLPPINQEWVLCVTAFDVSALPLSNRIAGETMAKALVDALDPVNRRIRVSREYAYYADYARAKALAGAGQALAAKREERDLLLYQGNPSWKYRRELKTADEAIAELEEAYRGADKIPPIADEPEFRLAGENAAGGFPPPPGPGNEYRFCRDQKADAFLAGSASEYYGRILISLKLYTLFTRSFQYEDSIVFSLEDMNSAVDELAGRLTAAVSGSAPAAITVKAAPAHAAVIIDNAFAGRGGTTIIERPPGPVELRVFAGEHRTFAGEVELNPGELAELYINLTPIAQAALTITAPGISSASVYRGALYAGEAPLTINLDQGSYEYISVESPEGSAAMVFQGIDGSAVFNVRESGPRQVERMRRRFYGAWGRFWVALPAAILINGIAATYTNAYNYRGDPGIYDEANNLRYISIAAWTVFGCTVAESIYRAFRYLYSSNEGVIKMGK
ncbi:MAG: PEGA domain-containing protein [Treponema sp.]|nr:PEGA domain-containing protein [Treponema sp.]